MSFDCGNCLVDTDQKVFDLIISSHDNFHLGKYCNFKCLQDDISKIASQYESNQTPVPWETMHKDLLDFFSGGSNPVYEYLLPNRIIGSKIFIDLLNDLFHNCNDPSLQKQILCYWISCVEPDANWPNVKDFEEVKLPKVFVNGAMIDTDDGKNIIVTDGDLSLGENFFVKIKDQIHNISVDNISFNLFEQEGVS